MGSRLLLPVIIAVAAFGFSVYEFLGVGRRVYNHQPGVCTRVEGPHQGSEDIELIPSFNVAFISSGVLHKQPNVEGKMFMYDLSQKVSSDKLPVAQPVKIQQAPFEKEDFHPHGLAHWIIDGKLRLYVINHNRHGQHSILYFDYEPSTKSLVYKQTIEDSSLIRPNDLVAVGPDQLIFTNDGFLSSDLGNALEIAVGYRSGSVYYLDGKKSHLLLPSMYGPNGVSYEKKNGKLFMNELNAKKMHVYDLDKAKRTLKLHSTVDLHSACDNFYLDETDGSLYTGCHPILHETATHLKTCNDMELTSASQILRVKFDKNYKTAKITEPYANDGSFISGSSVATLHKNQMLIGTVCRGLYHCHISHPANL